MKYFTIAELCHSRTAAALGIDNTPPPHVMHNLVELTNRVLDPARELWGKPLLVSSGFRCAALNAALPGASPSSQHLLGLAADLVTLGCSEFQNYMLFKLIRDSGIPYDQLIAEHWDGEYRCAWVHVSCSGQRPPRRQVLQNVKARLQWSLADSDRKGAVKATLAVASPSGLQGESLTRR